MALFYGANFVLDSAEKIGLYFGLSHLVMGLLIVGFGTSLPEFFVSQMASYDGFHQMSMGNIIGSNVTNLFLILGITGLFVPLKMHRKDILEQFYFHLGLVFVLSFILYQSHYNLYLAGVLILFFVGYLIRTFKEMKREQNKGHHHLFEEEQLLEGISLDTHVHEDTKKKKISLKEFTFLIAGFILLFIGGKLLVSSTSFIGRSMGVSEYVLAAIILAFGTSFPELMTSIVAISKKKDVDLITGNIIGSNIFNVSFVMGSLGFYKIEFGKNYWPEMVSLFIGSIWLLVLSKKNKNFFRLSGLAFLTIYFSMVGYWIYFGN